jgi:Ca-activated chloride channel family protein
MRTAPAAALATILGTAMLAASIPAERQQAIRARSEIVEVYATVTARSGAGVHDLRPDEFELFEDGERRDIAIFSTSVQPLAVAIVLDHSGSTDRQFEVVLAAARDFMSRLFREDRASLGTLTADCLPFTLNPRTLATAVPGKLPRDYGSPVWAATDRAMTSLASQPGRRVVLLFSDGGDNQELLLSQTAPPPERQKAGACRPAESATLVRHGEVVERAERESVMIYVVGVDSPTAWTPGSDDPFAMGGAGATRTLTGPRPETAPADLARLANRTGGSLHELRDYGQVQAAFKTIVDELHLQYLLGFVPTKSDGKRHRLDVRVKRPGVSVRAREAYVAGGLEK